MPWASSVMLPYSSSEELNGLNAGLSQDALQDVTVNIKEEGC